MPAAIAAFVNFPNVSPELFFIDIGNFSFALRWYALAYILGFVLGWRVIVAALKRPGLWAAQTPPMAPAAVESLLTWVIVGTILGGRLGFVLFYHPSYFLAHPGEILRVWEGGMAFHGGLAGVIVAGLIWAHRNSVAPLQLGDAMAMVAPIGIALGRFANFVNAELWGRPTSMPWGVVFPGAAAQTCPWDWPHLVCARHPTQLYQAGLEGVLLGAVVLWLAWRRGGLRSPGLLTGVFVGGYGAARFVVEFWREADAQFITPLDPLGHVLGLGPLGVTMGQLLSLPMIAAGLWLVLRARARRAPNGLA